MKFESSLERVRKIEPPAQECFGGYMHVADKFDYNTGKLNTRIHWNPETQTKVTEPLTDKEKPFSLILLDFDGTMVMDEGKNGIFAYAWRRMCEMAGIDEEDTDVFNRVYHWDQTTQNSCFQMVSRIQNGIDRYGNPLTLNESKQLSNLISEKTLSQFSKDLEIDIPQTPKEIARCIADRKEQLVKELLEKDPLLVLSLAPLAEGLVQFLDSIPPETLIAIISGSRVETTILPILYAHAIVSGVDIEKRVSAIVGEDMLSGKHHKPQSDYYDEAIIQAACQMRQKGLINRNFSREDWLFIGNRVGNGFDAPAWRNSMRHVLVHSGDQNLGPLTVCVDGFNDLLEAGLENENVTLSRIAHTLTAPTLVQYEHAESRN